MRKLSEGRRRRLAETKDRVDLWPSPAAMIAQSAQRLRASLELLRETEPLVDPNAPAWPKRRPAAITAAEAD